MVKIISWNPNGIRSLMKKVDLNKFVNDNKPDILCFNEIKASDPVDTIYFNMQFPLEGVNCIHRVCTCGRIQPLEYT